MIDRCQNAADAHDGLEQQDVNVLKLLYLIRYIDDIKANIENISILMIDDIHADKITLRASIAASLDRLLTQNYISRNGDTYTFLTDEEQDVAVEIKNTSVDSAQIVQSISQTVYGEIYPAKKFKYGRYDFAYDQYVDETLNGASCGGMRLRIVTAAADFLEGGEARLLMESQINNEAIVVLSADTPYYDELEQAMRIRKYVKKRNVSQMPESFQRIIRDRNDEARRLESHARSLIEKAIVDGKFYVHGEILEQRSGSAKEKLDGAMTSLVESVYSKLNYVNRFADSDADILEILNGAYEETGIAGTGANNEEALNEISQWLELKNQNGVGGTISMGDVQRRFQALPFGWREIDIAALVARLVVQQKIQIRYGGAVVEKDDRRLVDYLRKKSEIDKAIVVRKVAPPEELIRKSVAFLRDYKNAMDVPTDADALNSYVLAIFEAKREYCQKLLDNYYSNGTYDEISGEVVQTCCFVVSNYHIEQYAGNYIRLVDYTSSSEKEQQFQVASNRYTKTTASFMSVPGTPVCYWLSSRILTAFKKPLVGDVSSTRQGLKTSDDKRFIRLFYEVDASKIGAGVCSLEAASRSRKKWFWLNKGGQIRWYGNNIHLINWENDGKEIKEYATQLTGSYSKNITAIDAYFKHCISWPQISMSRPSFRFIPDGFIFASAGPSLFVNDEAQKWYMLGLLNSSVTQNILDAINPTINFGVSDILKVPFVYTSEHKDEVEYAVKKLVSIAVENWNAQELSWDFKRNPLI